MSRRLVRSYTVANLEDQEEIMAASAKEMKQKHGDVTPESDGDGDTEAALSPPKPKCGRGRPPVKGKSATIIAPKAPKGPASSAGGKQDPKPVTVRGKVLPQRSPLPARANRNTHPGVVSMPKPKRTSAEVAAAAEEKAALQRRIAELEQQRIETLAEMELHEELMEEAEERSVVRKVALTTSLDGTEDVEMWSKEGTRADVPTDSEMVSKDEADVGKQAQKPKQQRKKKPAKGETRAAVDNAKASLVAAGKKRKASVEIEATSDPKKIKASFPSGLVSNWQSKVSAPSQVSSKVKVSESKASETSGIGGLDDDDASTTFSPPSKTGTASYRKNDLLTVAVRVTRMTSRPKPKSSQKSTATIDSEAKPKSRSTNAAKAESQPRKNESVVIDSGSEDDVIPVKTSTVKPKSAQKSTAIEAKPKSRSTNVKVPKTESQASQLVPPPPAANISGVAASDVNTLPEFARSAWSTSFLPTLYSRLGSAPDPFVLDPDMVKVIQEILDIVYPDSDYQIRVQDKMFAMVKDRLNEKRSFFGRQALKLIIEFLKGKPYANKPHKIAEYAIWATRGNGPAIFGKPTPIDCVVPKKHKKYIAPDDIFETMFIIPLLSQYLKWCRGSCYNYGRPIGALAMAAGAVERGFMMFETGVQVDKGQFSRDIVGSMVGDHAYTAARLSGRRWANILALCGTHNLEVQPILGERSTQLNRRALYEPSSPTKGSDDE